MAKKNTVDRELSLPELEKKLRDTRAELFESRMKRQSGQLDKTHVIREQRREIARLNTFIHAKRAAAQA